MSDLKFKRSIRQKISCSRRLYRVDKTELENFKEFGEQSSPQGIGANLQVSIEFEAQQTSLDVEKKIKQVVKEWDHHFINEHADFVTQLPTLVAMSQTLYNKLQRLGYSVSQVEIRENPWIWASCRGDKVSTTQRVRIQCVHRHHNEKLSAQENGELYGQCASLHGHEYNIEVVYSEKGQDGKIKQLLHENLFVPYQGQYLNDHIGNTSGEIICEYFFSKLRPLLPGLKAIRLRETFKNSFIVEESEFSQ